LPDFPTARVWADDTTLRALLDHLAAHFDTKGTNCPLCLQRVRLSHRKLNRGHVLFMLDLARLSTTEDPWVHRKQCTSTKNRDYNVVKDWGLIRMKPNDTDPTKKESGYWRLTDKGERFLRGKVRVPKYVYIYNNTVLGESDETVAVGDAWGEAFDFEDFMAGF
jgi:TusA-related sulfurtransferase